MAQGNYGPSAAKLECWRQALRTETLPVSSKIPLAPQLLQCTQDRRASQAFGLSNLTCAQSLHLGPAAMLQIQTWKTFIPTD